MNVGSYWKWCKGIHVYDKGLDQGWTLKLVILPFILQMFIELLWYVHWDKHSGCKVNKTRGLPSIIGYWRVYNANTQIYTLSSGKSCEGTNKGEDTGDGRMSMQLAARNSISDRKWQVQRSWGSCKEDFDVISQHLWIIYCTSHGYMGILHWCVYAYV